MKQTNPFITLKATRIVSSHPSRLKPSDFETIGFNLFDIARVMIAINCESDTHRAAELYLRDEEFPYTVVDPDDVELLLSKYYEFAYGRKFDCPDDTTDAKKIKAFGIIKEKQVNIWALNMCGAVGAYNASRPNDMVKPLIQEEYDLLKEVLK